MKVLNKMIVHEPFKACLLVRATYVPTFAKNYGLACLDAPLRELFAATVLTSSFYFFRDCICNQQFGKGPCNKCGGTERMASRNRLSQDAI